MAIFIDPPLWPAHGRLWSHLISDESFDELHAFARALDVPARGFEGDHYDVPEERYRALIAAGAAPVSAHDLLHRLRAAGLRRPKRRGERIVASVEQAAGVRVDVIRSALPPTYPVRAVWALAARASDVLAVPADGGWAPPRSLLDPGTRPTDAATELLAPLLGTQGGGWQQVGYLRRQAADDRAADRHVELVLRAGGDAGGARPPARWVQAATLGTAVPLLLPLLRAVLPTEPRA
jgi:Protein of unknown function (DUF4031)